MNIGRETPQEAVQDDGFKNQISDEDKDNILRLQIMKAEQGDTRMLIWLGKQYLGQKDQPTELAIRPISDVVFVED